jgi:hypothetical protein
MIFYLDKNFRPIFAQNILHMAKGSSRFIYWILFLATTALFLFAIASRFEYLTMILPFLCTFFVKAMDII